MKGVIKMEEFLNGMSMDIEEIEREKLRKVFPQCFSDGKLDIDKLLNLCGEYQHEDYEKYKFEWKGKAECFQIAGKRTMGTLRPCKEESVNFDETQNLYIEGDNLEVLKILQRSYFNKVKMIYIDPPYNTGNDFVYEDDFKDPIQHYKEVTSQATKSNPETMGRFHTAWLNMMFPRLRLAYNLLREDGVCFISIDDHEVHNLRKICDEVFGEENFVAQVVWERAYAPVNLKKHFSVSHDYIVCYAKQLDNLVCNGLPRTDEANERYTNPDNDPRGVWKSDNFTVGPRVEKNVYEITTPSGRKVYPPSGRCWRVTKEKYQELLKNNRVWFGESGNNSPSLKRFITDVKQGITPMTIWKYSEVGHSQDAMKQLKDMFDGKAFFDYPKSVDLIKRMLQLYTTPNLNDIIFDFFSGSATTAHAVMELNKEDGGNRKFIMIQLPELCNENTETFKAGYKNICEIGKERIRRAGKKLLEESSQMSLEENKTPLDVGFKVFKLDSSNLKAWDSSPLKGKGDEAVQELIKRLDESVDRRKPDRSDLDMVYEVMLKLGIQLTEPVMKIDFDGKIAYSIKKECLLLVCLDKDLEIETIDKMTELAPAYIVFGQECLKDVSSMSNAKLLLRRKKIGMKFV
jgi:Adenine specific DNA methylase Mod